MPPPVLGKKFAAEQGKLLGRCPRASPGGEPFPGAGIPPAPVPDPILLKLKPTLLHPWALPLVATLRRCQAPTERVGVLGGGGVGFASLHLGAQAVPSG